VQTWIWKIGCEADSAIQACQVVQNSGVLVTFNAAGANVVRFICVGS